MAIRFYRIMKCSPGCQQSQLSPVSCSPREAEARLWWEAPGSSLPSLKRFWIAWGFKIGIPAPGGKRWPSSNIGIVFPKPVGRAQRIWFGSCSSNALCNMSNWRHCDQLNTYCMKGARTNLEVSQLRQGRVSNPQLGEGTQEGLPLTHRREKVQLKFN